MGYAGSTKHNNGNTLGEDGTQQGNTLEEIHFVKTLTKVSKYYRDNSTSQINRYKEIKTRDNCHSNMAYHAVPTSSLLPTDPCRI